MVSSSYLSVGGRVGALGCRPPSSPSRSLKYVRIGHPSCHISPAGFQRWCRLLLSVRFRADNDVNYDPPSLRNSTSFHAAGLRSGAVQVRLLQQCPIWTVNVNNLNSSACPELCSTVGRHTTTLHRSWEICTGCPSSSASSTRCVFWCTWCTLASTHHIWWIPCFR